MYCVSVGVCWMYVWKNISTRIASKARRRKKKKSFFAVISPSPLAPGLLYWRCGCMASCSSKLSCVRQVGCKWNENGIRKEGWKKKEEKKRAGSLRKKEMCAGMYYYYVRRIIAGRTDGRMKKKGRGENWIEWCSGIRKGELGYVEN